MSAHKGSFSAPVDESVGVVGLRNTATKNKLTDTVVPLWELQATADAVPAAECFNFTNDGVESVIGGDERVKVAPEHLLPGGKYRSIVKLFLRYENQPPNAKWPIATGWLIRPDLLVTAGHCAFDWGHNMGRLVQVKCYIGYNGHESIHDSRAQVQFRRGKRVATTLEWMTAKNNRGFDVAFIQVDPFTGVTPFMFAETPLSGTASMGVVGYPGDLRDEGTREPGAHMYEMFTPNTYNLAESEWRMLEYQIDTYGGNSGSPVIRESDHVSIGVHVYGGSPNSASVIGMYGNPFLDYVAAFDLHAQKVTLPGPGAVSTPGVQYITVPTSKTPDAVTNAIDLTGSTYGSFNTREGFTHEPRSFPQGVSQQDRHARSIYHQSNLSNGHGNGFLQARPRTTFDSNGFQSVGFQESEKRNRNEGDQNRRPIINNALGSALPMALGPLGGPISSLASIAISAAGKLAESGVSDSGSMDPTVPEGLTERAIMAEATFQAMMKMNQQTLAEEGFLDDMWKTAQKLAPVVKQVAPKVLEAVAQPALQIALQSLGHVQKSGAEGFHDGPKTTSRPKSRNFAGHESYTRQLPLTGAEAFLSRFEAAASSGEEGLIDDIFNVARTAVETAGPVLATVAKHGLPLLQGILTEADFDEPQNSAVTGFDGLHERAILAEAALQAAMNTPQNVLEEEGFFSFMVEAAKKIAPVVMKAAPVIVKNVGPIISNLLGASDKTEAFTGATGKGLRSLTLGANHAYNGNGADDELWKKLQNHHAAGEQGEEFFGLIGTALSLLL